MVKETVVGAAESMGEAIVSVGVHKTADPASRYHTTPRASWDGEIEIDEPGPWLVIKRTVEEETR